MRHLVAAILASVLAANLPVGAEAPHVFRYRVRLVKPLGDERGELRLSRDGVEYKSENGKTVIRIPLSDVLHADLSDRHVIRLRTYDISIRKALGRRAIAFRVEDAEIDEGLIRFLAANSSRPMTASYSIPGEGVEIPAYHRHRFGGCHGVLVISEAGIRFVSRRETDSRTWLYRDVETVGSMNEFHFRVSTLIETFNLDLKERIPLWVYERVWRHVSEGESRNR